MQIYVSAAARQSGAGTQAAPFQTISQAAQLARPGDEVLVGPGIYRERVDPRCGGESSQKRITYRSLEKGGAVITGAERVDNWEKYSENLWVARISNGLFGGNNPYTTRVSGDWFVASMIAHTGDVYLNGKSMYEVAELEKAEHPQRSMASWDPDFSVYTWYTEQDEAADETVIYANFQDKNPNKEMVEISVRNTCFYPSREGINYITFSGFTVCMAATQWAPPTAYQEGMVGPHWSKGWIIEDCEIFESKCSGISLGKYFQPNNDNKWLHKKYKDGTQTERECICQAQAEGWAKETVGSHIVRRCNIHDCGQTGIVGHLGGVFSVIEDNHIHHINNKQNLAGAEIGGIKMHAAIDVTIRRNHFHHCTRGLWLDWQAQGTRVTQNFFHHNTLPNLAGDATPETATPEETAQLMMGMGEDIFVEVSHGPTLIDNNLLLSARSLKLATQGVALVHNLVAGGITAVGIGTDNGAKTLSSPRYTPYHVPHKTTIAGFMTFLHGDMRFYNNIFVQQPVHPLLKAAMENMGPNGWDDGNVLCGTFPYNGYPTAQEWEKEFEGYCGMGSAPSDRYYMHLPVWAQGNVYCNGAKPWEKETTPTQVEGPISLTVKEIEGAYVVETDLYQHMPAVKAPFISTHTLGMAFEPEQPFENPDGTPIFFDQDYFGGHRAVNPMPGPFEQGGTCFEL
ncbi:right-handed parallel beta-helix repeat-containing protein [Acutalibacter caecimuris]|uniref:right-handed parallel beta-helix repeat-containing protein n=1 Tax=Acutalibacter caecimuris TaxID=3093657 RepID=UPI002AC9C118|nr:right-handed parallel beta-helix repeat-containing protein [Acutalibacter sp. M00118]